MESENVFGKANGHSSTVKESNKPKDVVTEDDENLAGDSGKLDVRGEGPFDVRDIILLDEMSIASGRAAEIIIRPNKFQGRSLVHRIVMHKSMAKLALTRMAHGEREISKGSGSCEIFLVEVPNYTPQKIYIDENTPLKLSVVNRTQFPLNVIGQVSIWRRENEGR